MMTDNEIIRALACLCGNAFDCGECPYCSWYSVPCRQQVAKDALALINRQQVEIERSKAWENLLKAEKHSLIKSEAIKEFATKLKVGVPQETGVVRCSDIDNLVKEIVGDTNG